MIVVRKDSPLVIGAGEGEFYIASDIPAILSSTRDIYFLENYEFAVMEKGKIDFYNKDLNKIEKKTKTIDWDASASEKDGFDHFITTRICASRPVPLSCTEPSL